MKIHKNLHVVALVAAMMALGAQAAVVSSSDVSRAVSAWASANGTAFANPGSAVAVEPMCDDDGTNVLCWIVSMSNGGAVIASPDTDLDLVVAVLEKYDGSFPAGHPLPSILKNDMRNRLAVLAERNAASTASTRPRLRAAAPGTSEENAAGGSEPDEQLEISITAANGQWAKYGVLGTDSRPRLRGASLDGGDASPYVRRIVDGFENGGRYTHWNQSQGIYNYYTPNNEVCGCVATAGAAILQFFNCTNDPGEVASTVKGGCHLYGASYSCMTLEGETDWTTLPAETYGGTAAGALDEAGKQLLGRATYNMGVLVGMSWAEDGAGSESGAYVKDLVGAFKKYGFKTSRYIEYSGASNSDGKEFFKTLYAQLWCGAPAVLSIQRPGAGHAVVACGYARDADGDEFCRVFMGWGGSGDNWYKFPTIQAYSMVQGAVTMIGYEDDAVVPVFGETNIPGVDLTLPGYVTNDVAVTVQVDEHGYFGIRVPVGITDNKITYAPRSASADILPFDPAAIADESTPRANLDAALPNELYFPILNMTVKQTMASARAVAERDGKALLMVGGTLGTDDTKRLTEYIIELDDVSDLSNRFVYVVLSKNSSNWNEPDGDPVIGVFDPDSFDVNERWQESNARLDYENFIDYDASGETNVVVHTFTPDDVTALRARVDELLENGYAAYLRRHADIQVTIQGVNLATKTFGDVATVEPAYGVIANTWTNGETVVFSALGSYTNEAAGVIYSCVGWTTNAVPKDLSKLKNYTAGTTVSLQLHAGTTNTLTWVWDASHYRVTASSTLPYSVNGAGQAVTPANAWVAVGTRATVTAVGSVNNAYHFSSWEVKGKVDYTSSESAALYENGTAVSFFVNEPVTVKATYRNGANGAPTPTTRTIVFASSPAELAASAPLPVESGFTWGENTTLDNVFTFQNATYTDATGGVWACTNILYNGSISFGPGSYNFSSGPTVTCVWNLQTEGGDTPTPPPAPEPGAITIIGIEQAVDGSWTITVSGAVKDCWYWLYAADNLTAFSGETWTAGKATTVESNPQQAAADGTIVFHATATGSPCFWRAKATSTETGN